MKKVAFIVPYFGKFNNYFDLWLKSCSYNQNYDWLIFTDNQGNYDYPDNVKIFNITFPKLKSLIQQKFDFHISLGYPYKLCDYKPAYGYIFNEFIVGKYKAWGYCDIDLIWGNIDKFITEKLIDKYDKIGVLGHCTIYKNNYRVNHAFMLPIHGILRYKEVFSSPYNSSFDEEYYKSINNIFIENNLKIFGDLKIANTYTKTSNFRLTQLNLATKKYDIEKKRKNIFIWEYGNLIRYSICNSVLCRDDYLYIHLQSRKMNRAKDVSKRECYKIIPNSFDYLDISLSQISVNNFPKYKHINLHYFRLRTYNLFDKMKKKIAALIIGGAK